LKGFSFDPPTRGNIFSTILSRMAVSLLLLKHLYWVLVEHSVQTLILEIHLDPIQTSFTVCKKEQESVFRSQVHWMSTEYPLIVHCHHLAPGSTSFIVQAFLHADWRELGSPHLWISTTCHFPSADFTGVFPKTIEDNFRAWVCKELQGAGSIFVVDVILRMPQDEQKSMYTCSHVHSRKRVEDHNRKRTVTHSHCLLHWSCLSWGASYRYWFSRQYETL